SPTSETQGPNSPGFVSFPDVSFARVCVRVQSALSVRRANNWTRPSGYLATTGSPVNVPPNDTHWRVPNAQLPGTFVTSRRCMSSPPVVTANTSTYVVDELPPCGPAAGLR